MAKDMEIDVNEAKKWNSEVAQELTEVRSLLSKVSAACTQPGMEDDAVIQILKESGEELCERWTGVCNIFDETMNITAGAVSAIVQAIQGATEHMKNMSK